MASPSPRLKLPPPPPVPFNDARLKRYTVEPVRFVRVHPNLQAAQGATAVHAVRPEGGTAVSKPSMRTGLHYAELSVIDTRPNAIATLNFFQFGLACASFDPEDETGLLQRYFRATPLAWDVPRQQNTNGSGKCGGGAPLTEVFLGYNAAAAHIMVPPVVGLRLDCDNGTLVSPPWPMANLTVTRRTVSGDGFMLTRYTDPG